MDGSGQPAHLDAPPAEHRSALNDVVLVINRSWIPVGVTQVRGAMCLLARGVADVVLPGTYELHELDAWMARPPDDQAPVIRTVSTRVQVPEIVRLRSYDRVPVREAAFSKRNLYIRDQARCQYCGKEPGWSRLTVDHIVPRSRGGDTSWENCVVACKACNNTKGDRTPKEAGLTLDTAPRRPLWRSFLQGIKPKPSWQPFVARGRA